jgi:hypothetical protein
MAMLRGHSRLDQAVAHHRSSGRTLPRRAIEDRCHAIETPDLFFGGQCRIVGNIVSVSGEAVKGVHMRPQVAPDQK